MSGRRTRELAGRLVAATVVMLVASGVPAMAQDALVLDHGHIDAFTLSWQDDELLLSLTEDVTGQRVSHPPEDVLLHVKPDAALVLPDPLPPSLEFLGEPGDTVYYLPQTEDLNLIWPGWSTEQVPAGVFDNPLHIQISDVSGPGEVYLWQTGSFGESVPVLDDGGFQLPGTISPNANVHAHANWAFTAEGTYTLTAQGSGTLADGGTVTTRTATYTFHVGERPDPDPSVTLNIEGMADGYEAGDVVTLTAVQDPSTDLDRYRWFARPAAGGEWVAVPDANGDTYSFTATADLDGTEIIVRLYDENDEVVAASDPVALRVTGSGGDPEPPGESEQRITATLPDDPGALIISIDPDDNQVHMTDLELATSADRYVSTGDLRPVKITDTRTGTPGWTASGNVSDFDSGSHTLAAKHLGWAPAVIRQPNGGGVTPGAEVTPGLDSGDGLATSRTLASADPGAGAGTTKLGADLRLEAPTTLEPGTYHAIITFTAI